MCSLIVVGTSGCLTVFPPSFVDDINPAFNVRPGTTIVIQDEPYFEEDSVCERIEGKIGHHAPTITAFADGELLAAWYSYEGPHELTGSGIYMARRDAHGEWSEPWLHIDRPAGDGNPVLYSEDNRVWLFQAVVPWGWSTAHVELQLSSDRGQTWSDPLMLGGPMGTNVRFPPVRTNEGDLLLPAYDDLFSRTLFFSSNDGSEWTLSSAVTCGAPFECIQPSVARTSTGLLLAVMRNTGQQWLWVMASNSGGATWSYPKDSGFANPDSPANLVALASGNLVLTFNDSTTERRPLSIAVSADEGLTWPHIRPLVSGESTYSYPSAVGSANGLIHIVYSHGRESIRHIALNEAWIIADDK